MTAAAASPEGRTSGGVLVVGFGVTGEAVARYLRDRGEEVTVVDDRPSDSSRSRAARAGVVVVEAPGPTELVRLVAVSRLVVPSPGVPPGHPVYRAAAEAGVALRSEIELGWERLASRGDRVPRGVRRELGGRGGAAGPPPTLVAVTGTNGKSTVTTLVAAMINASGFTALAAGNIGPPFIEAAGTSVDVLVTEVSSFQLQFTQRFHPAVSGWLNLAEDHLDWHPGVAHYAAAKARIWAAQGPGDAAVVNGDDTGVLAAASDPVHGLRPGVERLTFALGATGDFHVEHRTGRSDLLVGPGGIELGGVDELPRALPLDVANGLAASALALAAGATVAGCRQALRQFKGLPHRVELVSDAGGVRWYDDSKATTPASVLAALAGFDSVVLIAGGRNKGLDLGVLGRAVPPVRAVVAIGEAADEVVAAFVGHVPVDVAHSMADAVAAAEAIAKPGDTVLLSPGCASFDWYRSYSERGDEFASLVAGRAEDEGSPP